MQYQWNIFLCVITALNLGMTGCYKKNSNRFSCNNEVIAEVQTIVSLISEDKSTHEDTKQNDLLIYYQETKAADVPLPFGAKLIAQKSDIAQDGAHFYVTYSIPDSREEIVAFYNCQMERYGWSLEAVLDARELVMLYAKPNRHAMIMIKESHETMIEVTVYYL
jgi:hypothetical protein